MAEESARKGKPSKILVLSVTLILLVLMFLIFEFFKSPAGSVCDNIFQQSSMQMGLRLKHLDSEGSLVLGRQQVQELGDQAQLTALNLKTCCIVLDAGKLSSEQFLQCQNTADAYAGKLDQAIEQVASLGQAKQAGNDSAIQQAQQQLKTLLGEAAALSGKLQHQVEDLPRPELRLEDGGSYFDEGFAGTQLSSDWQLNNADPMRWKQQQDSATLLIVTQKGSVRGSDQTLRNQFVLNRTIPAGDFEAIVKAAIQIQGQQNSLSFALWEDDDNYLEIGYRGFEHGYNTRRSPFFTKELQAQRNQIVAATRGHGGVQDPEVIYLKIERRGNQYSGYYAYAENDAALDPDVLEWVEIGTHAWIDFVGRPALWADNGSGTHYGSGASPEVPVEFDYILIRKL